MQCRSSILILAIILAVTATAYQATDEVVPEEDISSTQGFANLIAPSLPIRLDKKPEVPPLVKGYTCPSKYTKGKDLFSAPKCTEGKVCSPIGGVCASMWGSESSVKDAKCAFGGSTCKCQPGYSGEACDWGPTTEPTETEFKKEELARVGMAYAFAAGVYCDKGPNGANAFKATCPGFFQGGNIAGIAGYHASGASTPENSAEHTGWEGSSTWAGRALISKSQSPSGETELMVGFRGTMFGTAVKELKKLIADGDKTSALKMASSAASGGFSGIRSVLADLNIAKKMLYYNDPKTGEKKNIGYVHKGFANALFPFLNKFFKNMESDIKHVQSLQPSKATTYKPIITITGHSLGGAMATLFTSIVRFRFPNTRLKLITFGSPRVGSAQWNKAMIEGLPGIPAAKTDILRIVNGNDVVSLIPSFVGLFDSVMHAGPQVTLSFAEVPEECKKMAEIKNMLYVLGHVKCAIPSISAYHLNYGDNLRNWLVTHRGEVPEPWCKRKTTSSCWGF